MGVVAGVPIGDRIVELFPLGNGGVGTGVELCDLDGWCPACCCCVDPHINTVCLGGSYGSRDCCCCICTCEDGLSFIFGLSIVDGFSISLGSLPAKVTGDGPPDGGARELLAADGGAFESIKDGDDLGVFSELWIICKEEWKWQEHKGQMV